jgi:DNA-directed RNA polymerase specialized sigma subunit
MKKEELSSLIKQWKQAPSPTTTQSVLQSIEPIVKKAIRMYAIGGHSPTLFSKARLYAMESLKDFDPDRANLETYLLNRLRVIMRWSGQEQQAIRVPETLLLERRKVTEFDEEYQSKHGRPPSDQEVADALGISLERLEKIRSIQPGMSEGQLPVAESGMKIMPETKIPEANKNKVSDAVWYVYYDSDPRDQIILEHTYGLNGKPVLDKSAIAEKLKITPSAVTQRSAKLKEKIGEIDSILSNKLE